MQTGRREGKRSRPNVLFIMADQFHANCLGINGSQAVTPNLDRLAMEGVRFHRAYCNYPICGPSRACFVTGQYPKTHGVISNELAHMTVPYDNTMPVSFRKMGYQTALVGKSHMVGQWDRDGFEWVQYSDQTDGDWRDPLSCDYFAYLVEHGIGHLYDQATGSEEPPGRAFVSAIPEQHSLERWTGERALTFLRDRDPRRPFYLQLSFQRPHSPLTVPYDRELLYNPDEIRLPDNAADFFTNRFEGKPAYMKSKLGTLGGSPYVPENEQDLKRQLAFYYSLITLIDEQIGRVFEELTVTGELDNTVVVFTSDHGDYAGEHGFMFKTAGAHESLHRIPLLLKFPGGPADRQIDELVESVDLYPTLCELADIPVPETVEGDSLLPVLEGKAGKPHVVMETARNRMAAIRTNRYRLVYNGYGQLGELYDTVQDPGELHNLYTDPVNAELKQELIEKLLDYMKTFRTETAKPQYKQIGHKYRNTMTRLIHKHKVNWDQLKDLYVPDRKERPRGSEFQ